MTDTLLTIALSKGRIFEETLPLLAAAGIVPASRTLSRVQNPIFNYRASLAEYHAATNYPQTKLLIPIYIEC